MFLTNQNECVRYRDHSAVVVNSLDKLLSRVQFETIFNETYNIDCQFGFNDEPNFLYLAECRLNQVAGLVSSKLNMGIARLFLEMLAVAEDQERVFWSANIPVAGFNIALLNLNRRIESVNFNYNPDMFSYNYSNSLTMGQRRFFAQSYIPLYFN